MVHDELEAQLRDQDAGVAVARGRALHSIETAAVGEKGRVDRVQQQRAVDSLGDDVAERGVTLELGELELGSERPDHRLGQVAQDVLGVLELAGPQEARVA